MNLIHISIAGKKNTEAIEVTKSLISKIKKSWKSGHTTTVSWKNKRYMIFGQDIPPMSFHNHLILHLQPSRNFDDITGVDFELKEIKN